MGRRIGVLCVLLGVLLVLGAGALWGRNELESEEAGMEARRALGKLQERIPEQIVPEETETVTRIDGYGYIGYLRIPRLELELPVMDSLDEERLRTAPCRFSGSSVTDDLVLAGHNYRRHFGPIRRLKPGDEVSFTDMGGTVIRYQVVQVDTVPPDAVEDTVHSGWDLVLVTCTYGGEARIRVGCDRLENA